MTIRDAVRKTGLQKRTIYFYISRQLLSPPVNPDNGYHIFSEEDITRLNIIRCLRECGVPLADIRAILTNPRTAPYYLHKRLNRLQTELLSAETVMEELDRITADLPVCRSLSEIADRLSSARFQPDLSRCQPQFESRDARLIARYLWQAYLDGPMTDYRQFLWQKIMQDTAAHIHTDLKAMARYLQFLPPEQLDEASVTQFIRAREIIALEPCGYSRFVEEMEQSLERFCSDPVQQEQWKLLYCPVIRPSTTFAYSASHWMTEFHPDYQRYYNNIHACCMMLKEKLKEECLLDRIADAFAGAYDFESSSYGELEIAASFQHSVYSMLTPEQIREFLKTL
ncbi:hypothetical protein B5F07_04540 [Lachnoclostridium sp. An169]|uniref:helix-turn-helix domain-containing protein n=1 Tax=Lachnoclostridium sp. An169 TaxID=1965569 RepID=UPI000B385F97|nr:MerR family transcriptional regulator [Lachnoclostridium sp. An169]OUP85417.1 hypothetical protein B5F07_04540 [Lachnoclostridium sp. An169]HJA65041.1 MerR family transcriptional regulator [Candidatus Mediterraneibacter cottocaccae]